MNCHKNKAYEPAQSFPSQAEKQSDKKKRKKGKKRIIPYPKWQVFGLAPRAALTDEKK